MKLNDLTSSLTGVAGRISRDPFIILKHPDILLAILVISMLGMMIIPLPPFILDLFLTLNITFAITLLISSLYIPNAISIASFPTLLLLTTLYRLSLNVSSTRLILLNGYAGEVINSFGRFVVKGNYVVGGVIFLILTLIQFIVIAKGSERVAEVSARFNLDSMPGKQMSIDADLRTGAITMDEAKALRRELERENQFYGAMDGAMKFVKGDAIAGILITAINIIGGLAIGVLEKGYELNTALKKYTILTIGDGLVSQIPSIVISTAAGIVVTRVASQEQGSNIGREISLQLTKYPPAILIVSALLILLSLIPGLPKLPFFLMGCAMAFGGYLLIKKRKKGEVEQGTKEERKVIPGALPPLTVQVPANLIGDMKEFEHGIKLIAQSFLLELGIKLPDPDIHIIEGNKDGVAIKLFGNEVVKTIVPEGTVLTTADRQLLKEYRIDAEDGFILNGGEYLFVRDIHREELKNLGYSAFSGSDIVLFLFKEAIFINPARFLGINEVQEMLDGISGLYPALVREVVPRIIGLPEFTLLLRRLVAEEVPIRNLKAILEAVAIHGQREKSIPLLTELVRRELKEEICSALSNGNREIRAYILSPALETQLLDSVVGTGSDIMLSFDPEFASQILNSIEASCFTINHNGRRTVIITQQELRALFRNFIAKKFPKINVISYDELSSNFTVYPLGEISIEN